MIYTDIYKDKLFAAKAEYTGIKETTMVFARMLDKCATFAQDKLNARISFETGDSEDDYTGLTINLGSASELEDGIDDTYIKNEPVVMITIGRYAGIDNPKLAIPFEHPADQRDCEKYDIAFMIQAWVGKLNKNPNDPEDIIVKHSCVSEKVVYMVKYPDEIINSEMNHGEFRNDYERYDAIHDDEGRYVLKFISDLWNGGCDEFIPEKYQDDYDDITSIIDEHLHAIGA